MQGSSKQEQLNRVEEIRKPEKQYDMKKHEKLISEITDYINENYKKINSVEEIASHFYISASYMRKIYKKYTKNTIFDVLFQRRMEEAKKLLKSPEAKVYEVAEQVGYKGKRYFIDAFREYTGFSPKEFQLKFSDIETEK